MNNTSDFLLSESQLKKLQHTVSFFNISTAIFLVVNVLTWGYLIAHVSLILDGNLIAFIIPLIPIYAFVWLPMILIFFPLHFMKQKIKKLMLGDGTKHTFGSKNMLKTLLFISLCTGFVYFIVSLVLIACYPLVDNPNYSCVDYWQQNYEEWDSSDSNLYIEMCKTQYLAKDLTLPLVLVCIAQWLAWILFSILSLKYMISWRGILKLPAQTQFLNIQISFFVLHVEVEMDDLKEKADLQQTSDVKSK